MAQPVTHRHHVIGHLKGGKGVKKEGFTVFCKADISATNHNSEMFLKGPSCNSWPHLQTNMGQEIRDILTAAMSLFKTVYS